MRPLKEVVQLASRFQSQITLIGPDNKRANARSMLDLLGLAADQGTELVIEAQGPDQEEAVEALAQFLATFSEENTSPA